MANYVVLCVNYTGMNFRGYADPTDSQLCRLTMTGHEDKIVSYLLYNCSYGPPRSIDGPLDMAEYIELLHADRVPQFDGCGAVLEIVKDGEVLFDVKNDYMKDGEDVSDALQFDVDVNSVAADYGHLNRIVKDKIAPNK